MSQSISKHLMPLASLAIQHKDIVNGTKESYLLPCDLLNDGYDIVRQVRTMDWVRNRLSDAVVQAICELEPLLNVIDLEAATSNEQLIEHDADWRAMRNHSERILKLLERQD